MDINNAPKKFLVEVHVYKNMGICCCFRAVAARELKNIRVSPYRIDILSMHPADPLW